MFKRKESYENSELNNNFEWKDENIIFSKVHQIKIKLLGLEDIISLRSDIAFLAQNKSTTPKKLTLWIYFLFVSVL